MKNLQIKKPLTAIVSIVSEAISLYIDVLSIGFDKFDKIVEEKETLKKIKIMCTSKKYKIHRNNKYIELSNNEIKPINYILLGTIPLEDITYDPQGNEKLIKKYIKK